MAQQAARSGPDGVLRAAVEEDRLNKLFHSVFTTPAGAEVLKHLRRLTIETAGGPAITNDELRHREGQRFLVYLIQARITLAETPPHDREDRIPRRRADR